VSGRKLDAVKIENSRGAARRYVIEQDKSGDRYPAVPEDYGPVHALLWDSRPGPEKQYPLWRNKIHREEFLHTPEEAACGVPVRLVFPVPFDDKDEEDACPDCLAMVDLWVRDRPAYDRIVTDRRRRRWERENERRHAQETEEALDAFILRQARALGDIPQDGGWDDMFSSLDGRETVWDPPRLEPPEEDDAAADAS
jgi:hypothetical protein